MIQWPLLIVALLFGAVAGWVLARRDSVSAGFAALGGTTGLMLGLSTSPVVAASVASLLSATILLIPLYFQPPPAAPPSPAGSVSRMPALGIWLFPFALALLTGLVAGITLRANDGLNFTPRSLREQYKQQGFSEPQVDLIMEQQAKLLSAVPPPQPLGSPGRTVLHSVTRPADWDKFWTVNYREQDTPEENLQRIEAGSKADVQLAIKVLRSEGQSATEILAAIKQRFSR